MWKKWSTIDEYGVERDLKKEGKCRKCNRLFIIDSKKTFFKCYDCWQARHNKKNVGKLH